MTDLQRRAITALEISERLCDTLYWLKIEELSEVKMQLRFITRELGLSVENDSLTQQTTLNLKARKQHLEDRIISLESDVAALEKDKRKLNRRKWFWKTCSIAGPVAVFVLMKKFG